MNRYAMYLNTSYFLSSSFQERFSCRLKLTNDPKAYQLRREICRKRPANTPFSICLVHPTTQGVDGVGTTHLTKRTLDLYTPCRLG